MIKVRVGSFLIGKARDMVEASEMADNHIIGLAMNGCLKSGESINVDYCVSGQVVKAEEVVCPELAVGGLLIQ